jgi:pseudouridine-5'-phosphate glycosidase
MEKTITVAIDEMNAAGIKGKESTPYLLKKVKELTQGKSLDTNIQLVLNNAKVAAEIAVEYSKITRA